MEISGTDSNFVIRETPFDLRNKRKSEHLKDSSLTSLKDIDSPEKNSTKIPKGGNRIPPSNNRRTQNYQESSTDPRTGEASLERR
jgi:hypothetical protein